MAPATPKQNDVIGDWRNWLRWYLLLLVVFAFDVGVGELRTSEAVHHAISSEIVRTGDVLHPRVHGQPVEVSPLYAWTIVAAVRAGLSDWAVRVPAVLAVAAMGLLCARVAANAQGRRAGMVAGVIPLTTVAGLQLGTVASNDVVFALSLTLAWFAWFRLGRAQRRWGAAWGVALVFVFIAVLAGGIEAFLFFYMPLFFLRKPVRIWRRMLVPGHIAMLVLVGVLSGIWLAQVHGGETLTALQPFAGAAGAVEERSYFARLVSFPVGASLRLFPWVFLVWPGFCVAFRPVERPAVLCQYLRTICLVVFVPCWLIPGIPTGALLPLVCPVAVLTGLHYDILMRRHGKQLELLIRCMRRVLLPIACTGLGVASLHAVGLVGIEGLPVAVSCMSVVLFCGALVGLSRVAASGEDAFWFRLTIATVTAKLVWSGVAVPVGFVLHTDARSGAAELVREVPADATIYKLAPRPLVSVCRYLSRPVIRIETPSQVTGENGQTFVLGREKPPIEEDRVWKPCSAAVPIDARRGIAWHWRPSGRRLVSVSFPRRGLEGGRPTRWIRVYRGTPRTTAPVAIEGIDVDTILPAPAPETIDIEGIVPDDEAEEGDADEDDEADEGGEAAETVE